MHLSNSTISSQLARLDAELLAYLAGVSGEPSRSLNWVEVSCRWEESISVDLDSLYDDIALTWSPAEADFLKKRIQETAQENRRPTEILPDGTDISGGPTPFSIRRCVGSLESLIQAMIAKATLRGGAEADVTRPKRGRPRKTAFKKIDIVVAKIIRSGEADVHRPRWKDILGNYAKELPKDYKSDTLRVRVRREQQRLQRRGQ